ncbi:MAG: LacI family DNA-binding transcriptional regulator [Anaerolineae bacterium]|nr:LacI family DNA-binding transcriptional regulator [Anaerolineae bacterium]
MSTIRDVAQAAGVSPSTVSHVINETRYVSPSTRARVQEAMATLNYRPNRLARSLRNRETRTFGVLLPNSANPFFAQVLLGIEAACFDHGYNVLMGNANDDPRRELFYLELLLAKQVDGVLLVSTRAYDEAREVLRYHDAAVIIVDRSPADSEFDTVFADNERGGALATRHLVGLGHRRIGCIAGPSQLTPSADRVTGYRRALQEAGIAVDEALIMPGDFSHGSGYRACQRLLRAANRPSAIFVANDLMAVGALCAIHEAGLRVPQDVSVIGFDDIPLASYTVPRLTTIRQPSQEVGRVAVEMILRRLQVRHDPPRYERLPVTLVERDSCAPYANS